MGGGSYYSNPFFFFLPYRILAIHILNSLFFSLFLPSFLPSFIFCFTHFSHTTALLADYMPFILPKTWHRCGAIQWHKKTEGGGAAMGESSEDVAQIRLRPGIYTTTTTTATTSKLLSISVLISIFHIYLLYLIHLSTYI